MMPSGTRTTPPSSPYHEALGRLVLHHTTPVSKVWDVDTGTCVCVRTCVCSRTTTTTTTTGGYLSPSHGKGRRPKFAQHETWFRKAEDWGTHARTHEQTRLPTPGSRPAGVSKKGSLMWSVM